MLRSGGGGILWGLHNRSHSLFRLLFLKMFLFILIMITNVLELPKTVQSFNSVCANITSSELCVERLGKWSTKCYIWLYYEALQFVCKVGCFVRSMIL